jgi:hypothetical protein
MVWFPVNFPSTNPLNYGNITRFFFHGGADNLGDRDGDLNIKLVTKKTTLFTCLCYMNSFLVTSVD